MVSKDLLDILVCPYCKTKVNAYADRWLVCQNADCRRKYPIKDEIPVMLIEEGDKWKDTEPVDLPDPASLRF